MKIFDKRVLDCDPLAAWRALHSPAVFAELYGPVLSVSSADGEALPLRWTHGETRTVAMQLGAWTIGHQRIHTIDRQRDGARIMRDAGSPLSGPLGLLRVWDHQLAIAPAPQDGSKTLWRERLTMRGAIAPILWMPMWAMWQVRGMRLTRLAKTWAYDPEPVDAPAEE